MMGLAPIMRSNWVVWTPGRPLPTRRQPHPPAPSRCCGCDPGRGDRVGNDAGLIKREVVRYRDEHLLRDNDEVGPTAVVVGTHGVDIPALSDDRLQGDAFTFLPAVHQVAERVDRPCDLCPRVRKRRRWAWDRCLR